MRDDFISFCFANEYTVQIVCHENNAYVPVKPICEILGVNYSSQVEKIRSHPVFSHGVIICPGIIDNAGKRRSMIAINKHYLYPWLFSINPKNVKEEIRDDLMNLLRSSIQNSSL